MRGAASMIAGFAGLALAMPLAAQPGIDQAALAAAMARAEALDELHDLLHEEGAAEAETLALQVAADRFARGDLALCGADTPEYVVVPAESGANEVYILSDPASETSFPLAGHHRLVLDAAGTVTAEESLPGECRMADWGGDDEEGMALRAAYILRPDDAQPGVLDFFVSRNLPYALGVITSTGAWPVLGGYADEPTEMTDFE